MEEKQFNDNEISYLSNEDLYKELQLVQEELAEKQSKFMPYVSNNIWCEFEEVANLKEYLEILKYEWISRDAERQTKQYRNTCQKLH